MTQILIRENLSVWTDVLLNLFKYLRRYQRRCSNNSSKCSHWDNRSYDDFRNKLNDFILPSFERSGLGEVFPVPSLTNHTQLPVSLQRVVAHEPGNLRHIVYAVPYPV